VEEILRIQPAIEPAQQLAYLDTKALVLTEAANGESAVESVKFFISDRTTVEGFSVAERIFDSYVSAMELWAQAVDKYQASQNTEDLRQAALELEAEIDEIVPLCQDADWSFEPGWR
jgi:hypothetical protein